MKKHTGSQAVRGAKRQRRTADTAIEALGGRPLDVEASLATPPPRVRQKQLNACNRSGVLLIDYLLRRDGVEGPITAAMRDSKLDDIKAGEHDRAWLEDRKFWVALLHAIALSSASMIANPHHQRSFPLQSSAPVASAPAPASAPRADQPNVAATKKSMLLHSQDLALLLTLRAPREGQVTAALQTLQTTFASLNRRLELQDLPRVSAPPSSKLLRSSSTTPSSCGGTRRTASRSCGSKTSKPPASARPSGGRSR